MCVIVCHLVHNCDTICHVITLRICLANVTIQRLIVYLPTTYVGYALVGGTADDM